MERSKEQRSEREEGAVALSLIPVEVAGIAVLRRRLKAHSQSLLESVRSPRATSAHLNMSLIEQIRLNSR